MGLTMFWLFWSRGFLAAAARTLSHPLTSITERCFTPAAVWPLSRMQLWIFTSQRDNEVSSGAKNEPVVLPRGSWGLFWLPEPAFCRTTHLQRYPPVTDRIQAAYSTTLTWASGVSTVPHTWHFTASGERVVITICWKVSF